MVQFIDSVVVECGVASRIESSPSLPNTDRGLPNDANLALPPGCKLNVGKERQIDFLFSVVFYAALFIPMENNEVTAIALGAERN